jgi:hypothetical protein
MSRSAGLEIMTGSPQLTLKPAPGQAAPVLRRLIAIDLICGTLLVAPLFRPETSTAGLRLLAVMLVLPYLVVCWRLLRIPEAKEGPGLAAGIGAVFVFLAALGCAATVEQHFYLRLAYFCALGLTHGLMAAFGYFGFKQGTSKKPAWRVVVRSIIDPVVYYGIVFFTAVGVLIHR